MTEPDAQWTARPTDSLRLWADLARGHLGRSDYRYPGLGRGLFCVVEMAAPWNR